MPTMLGRSRDDGLLGAGWTESNVDMGLICGVGGVWQVYGQWEENGRGRWADLRA